MSLSRLMRQWQGALLSLIGIVATVWLGFTGQLGLYIHPRYSAFALVMAGIAAVIVIVSFALGSADDEHDHDHGQGHDHEQHQEHGHAAEPRSGRIWALGSLLVVVASAVALLLVPPATLTTATVENRDLNGSASALSDGDAAQLVGGDASEFSVKDWAVLLRQGAGPEFFAGKTAELTGFVTPDSSDPENVFYVARFVVTHCVVDAQPVGVPVHRPGWQQEFAADSWVGVSGGFASNPSVASSEGIVLVPREVVAIDQPEQPYVY